MCQFIETISIKNKEMQNSWYHQQRINKTLLHFQANFCLDLSTIIIPIELDESLYKCRISYNLSTIEKIEYKKYIPKIINSVELIENNDIDYPFKYANREVFLNLLKKSTADEIIIIKNNLITDSSYSNLCFYDSNQWVTPATPLLKGIMRNILLDQNKIKEALIRPNDLKKYSTFKLINALNEFDDSPSYSIGIVFSF